MRAAKVSTHKKAQAKTVHAKVAAHRAPMAMLDAIAKAIARHVKAKDNVATTQDQVNVKGAAKVARKDKATQDPVAIAHPVKSTVHARTSKTMISNPVPTRTWAHKAASMHSVTSQTVATAHVNPTPPAPAST